MTGRSGVGPAEHFHGIPVDIPQARESTDGPWPGNRIDAKTLPCARTDERGPLVVRVEDAPGEQDPHGVSPAAGRHEQCPHRFIVTIGHHQLYSEVVLAT